MRARPSRAENGNFSRGTRRRREVGEGDRTIVDPRPNEPGAVQEERDVLRVVERRGVGQAAVHEVRLHRDDLDVAAAVQPDSSPGPKEDVVVGVPAGVLRRAPTPGPAPGAVERRGPSRLPGWPRRRPVPRHPSPPVHAAPPARRAAARRVRESRRFTPGPPEGTRGRAVDHDAGNAAAKTVSSSSSAGTVEGSGAPCSFV